MPRPLDDHVAAVSAGDVTAGATVRDPRVPRTEVRGPDTLAKMDIDNGRRRAARLRWLIALGVLVTAMSLVPVAVAALPERTNRAEVCYGPQRPGTAEQVIPRGLLRHDGEDFEPSGGVCSTALQRWCDSWTWFIDPQAVAWRERSAWKPLTRSEKVVVYADAATSRAAYRSQRKMHASCQPYREGGIAYSYQGIEPVPLGDEAFLGLETHIDTGQDGRSIRHVTLVVRRGTALAIYHGQDRDEVLADSAVVAAAMCRYAPGGC